MRLWALSLGLLALVPFVQRGVDAHSGPHDRQESILYLPTGQQVRRMAPGLENVLADIYWLRTVQYFGGQRAFAATQNFELLEPLIEITTTLDPRFELAYRYGAVFLAEPHPNGAGKPRAAMALLARAAELDPGSWRLRQDIGFFHFFYLHDSEEAARVLLDAARIPGAPTWLRSTAADFLRKGGERETSRQVWRHLSEESDGLMRENALFNLARLDALDGQDAVQAAVGEFQRRSGRLPGDLGEVARAGLLRVPPQDPSGVPFGYDPVKGTVSIDRKSVFWRAS